MPKKNPNNRNEHLSYLSVCIISVNNGSILDKSDIWKIGCIIEIHSNRIGKLEARADIDIKLVNQIGLDVEVDGIPIKEHANFKSFPKSTIACQRLATYLALNSQLEIR